MSKFKNNIKNILMLKALKKIQHLVDDDNKQERKEKMASKLIVGLLMLFFLAVLFVFLWRS